MYLALEEDLVSRRLTDAFITAAWDARKITWKQKSEFTLAKEKDKLQLSKRTIVS